MNPDPYEIFELPGHRHEHRYADRADKGPVRYRGVGYQMYNEKGVYELLSIGYDKCDPSSFRRVTGEPVPLEFEEFQRFIYSLKCGQDVVDNGVHHIKRGEVFLNDEDGPMGVEGWIEHGKENGQDVRFNERWMGVSNDELYNMAVERFRYHVNRLSYKCDELEKKIRKAE
jgi:hypothetical protein